MDLMCPSDLPVSCQQLLLTREYTYVHVCASEGYLSLLESANCRLELNFSEQQSNTLACVIYAKFPGKIDIDRARGVYVTSSG
jgi:hypothetical protein